MSPQTFIFFGPSGSGKGTQAKLLMDVLAQKDPTGKILYLETGQRLRDFAKTSSYTAIKTGEILDSGGLMPEFVPIWVWTQFFVDNFVTGDEHVVLDGVSRQLHEAQVIDSALQFYKRQQPWIILIKVSPHWAVDRLKERGQTGDRPEDNDAKEIARRLEWYEKNVVPALNHFKNNAYYKFIEVNGEQSIEAVHQDILDKIGL